MPRLLFVFPLFLLACTGVPEPVDDAGDGDPDAGNPDAGNPDAGDTDGGIDDADGGGVDELPTIDEVLTCGTPGSAGVVGAGTTLFRVDIDLGTYPNALCNDGSGAAFFVRKSSDIALADSWLIRTQGGGGCRDGNSCADRWCSAGSNFGQDKMTSTLLPARGMNAPGVHSRSADNPFAGANHVFLHYCSSDSWTGQNHSYQAESDRGDFTLRLHGADIFDAVIATLQSGAIAYEDEDELAQTMPDLDDADRVLFAGASAGAAGVTWNADRLTAALPGSDVRALHDSNFGVPGWQLDFAPSRICTDLGFCDYESWTEENYLVSWLSFRNARIDQSCLDLHSDDAWRCSDLDHVIREHITTPIFVRMDLQDGLIMPNQQEAGFAMLGGGALTDAVFAQTVKAELELLADLQSTAEEGTSIRAAPGFMGPSCGKHETLGNNGAVYATTVQIDTDDYLMWDLVMNWWDGVTPQGGTAVANGDGCP
jgi:hypothetical protein